MKMSHRKTIILIKIVLILNSIFICEALFKASKLGALTTVQLARYYKYPIKEYTVDTDDEVTLRLYRIPHGLNNKPTDNEPPRTPVLLMHGILCSSDLWLLMGPKKGLGFILADEKFDVWLGDFRGSRYSNELQGKKKKKKTEYWNASWHEMGIYDYPAFIDKIYNTKKSECGNRSFPKLIIFGQSMGTTAYYVLASMKPTFVEDNVELMITFSPVAFMAHIKSPLFKFLYGSGAKMMKKFGVKVLDGKFFRVTGRWLTIEKLLIRRIYKQILFLIAGYNHGQLDKSTLPKIFGHIPSGCTVKSLLHYGQLVKSDKFRQYDYGTKAENWKKYKQDTPPDYKLGNNPVPIVICYSINDWLSSRKDDMEKLVDGLRKGNGEIALFKVNDKKFNHMDYIFAKDVVPLLYKPIIDVIKNYTTSETTISLQDIISEKLRQA